MSPLSTLLTVAAIHWVAMVSPGPNVLLVAQTAMARSRRSALAVAVGVACGAGVLATGAAVGLALVIEQVGWLRHAIQIAGGAYLVYLGFVTWRGAADPPSRPQRGGGAGDSVRDDLLRGLLTNLTNPKAAVFFGSILAPTLDEAVSDWVRLAAVGVIVVDALCWHCLLALAFARPGVRRLYGRAKLVVDRVVGAALALFGARLVLYPR
jgi:threonine efflux protein